MNRFIRLGNIILNLDHVIEIRFQPPERKSDGKKGADQRPTLWITTSELTHGGYGTESSVLRLIGEEAQAAWDFLCSLTEGVQHEQ